MDTTPTPQPKKKIMYVITKGVWGGAQTYVYHLATNLPPEEYDVTVALGGGGALEERLKTANIRTIVFPDLVRDLRIAADIGMFFKLFKLFREEQPDIVHLNSSKIGGIGSFAAQLAGIEKIIFTAHGWAFSNGKDGLPAGLKKLFSWLTILFTHQTITGS